MGIGSESEETKITASTYCHLSTQYLLAADLPFGYIIYIQTIRFSLMNITLYNFVLFQIENESYPGSIYSVIELLPPLDCAKLTSLCLTGRDQTYFITQEAIFQMFI